MSFSPTPFTAVIGSFAVALGSAMSYISTPSTTTTPSIDTSARVAASQQLKRAAASPQLIKTVSSYEHSAALQTLEEKVSLMEEGREFLKSKKGYTTLMHKQEEVGGELLEPQTVFIKCRHEPFSVYLQWHSGDTGREVLYVEGTNNNRITAHNGGWKARLPALSLQPDCSLAMADTRYPATSAGVLGLVDIMLETHRYDLAQANIKSCERKSCTIDGRPCIEFTTVYEAPVSSPLYRKSVTRLDEEWKIPLESHHYTWPAKETKLSDNELDEETLIESYQFSEINFDQVPDDRDFDRDNPEYQFH